MVRNNIKIKDKNGIEKALDNTTTLYDVVNKISFNANYDECLDPENCWNMIIDNILNGRLIFNIDQT